ncbi:MAG TPA: hypothetical protein PLP01_09720 [Phycisphaerae bacterium]|nr:hypothetical protein [Phycisphaerae bacterium]HOI55513.1 hypothetical protein [Phycisphaerae bacterium]
MSKESSSRDLPPVRLANPTAEGFIASLKVVHFFAIVFFWLVLAALLLHVSAFVAFQAGAFDGPLGLSEPSVSAPEGTGAEASAAEAAAPDESAEDGWWTLQRSEEAFRYVRQLLATFRVIGLMAAVLLLVTMFLYLEISLLGRLAGVQSLTVAFFLLLLLAATVVSWEPLLPSGDIIGSLFKLDDFRESLVMLVRSGDAPTWTDKGLYYHWGRFLIEPVLSLVLLLAAWLQFRRGYEHSVLMNE